MESPTFYERLLAAPAMAGRPPRASAAVVPWRRDAAGRIEVYWVRRAATMRFMGGWYAFPGGGLAPSDADIIVEEAPVGAADRPPSSAGSEGDSSPAADLVDGLAACALRELFEETGLLLGVAPKGDKRDAAVGAASTPSSETLRVARRRLLAGELDFAGLAEENRWTVSAAELIFAGRWLTPPVSPIRFDNRFFLLEWSRERRPQPSLMGCELDVGEWIRPRRALARWQDGEVIAAPPILHILKVLAEDGPEDGLRRLRDPSEANLGPWRRIEFRPGVIMLPLRTPTLPPATHTNAFLLGRRQTVLIDPATPLADETERLRQALAAARRQGLEISAIWLTHHHPDHVGAVDAIRRELAVPVCAHRLTAERLERRGLRVDQELRDGQRVVLDGDPPFPLRVVHTPGHTRGHLCFFDETYGSLIAGDLASTLSTIVINPPEGDMDAYLKSLQRVIELEPRTLFPAHGPAVLGAVATLEELKRHRLEREEAILRSWREGNRAPSEIVGEVYADLPPQIHPVAERQIEAHLVRLRRRGKIPGA